ncbi:hypothetical protein MIR68_002448 [Amoeboaphelidium protococcarum]|nr:hypothetical protein MIR68_002448 [Amoeboaphelidium protococcarum]
MFGIVKKKQKTGSTKYNVAAVHSGNQQGQWKPGGAAEMTLTKLEQMWKAIERRNQIVQSFSSQQVSRTKEMPILYNDSQVIVSDENDVIIHPKRIRPINSDQMSVKNPTESESVT